MQKSIALAIQDFAKEKPEALALVVNGEKCTYSCLAECNRRAALYLERKGVKAGDRVLVEADHILSYVYLWYGIQLLGATFVPLEKQKLMMKTILHLHTKAKEIVAKEIPLSKILKLGLFDKLTKMKYDIPNSKPEMFDDYINEIDVKLSSLLK